MSESNYNWLCFSRRFHTREPKSSTRTPKCLKCKLDCYCLGYKAAIPKKSDIKAWKLIEKKSLEMDKEYWQKNKLRRVERTHEIEKELEKLKSLEPEKNRSRLIKSLETQLNSLRQR